MASFEELFNSSVLQVFAPGSALEFPDGISNDKMEEWLSRLYAEPTDRKVAFFDEVIEFLLVIRFPHPQDESEATSVKPPLGLLSFLAHLQISYEASYISPFTSVPSTSSGAVPEIGRPPPRTTSMNKDKPAALLAATHPNIFPPATPNPVPSAAKSDQQYVQSQGTQLTTGVWGEHHIGPTREKSEAFALLWATDEQEWVAVYRMSVLVRYMATKFEDPLLSLTVSTTLREKPLPVTPPRRMIAALLEEVGGSSNPLDILSPVKSAAGDASNNGEQTEDDDVLSGFEEINLLEGLQADPTFAASGNTPLRLPSTRLGPKTRHTAFGLPPVPGSSSTQQSRVSLTASAAAKTKLPPPPASATFRKSFRKTMKVVSGFHVRMRTVFVPYFLLPRNGQKREAISGGITSADDDEGDIETREQREAGNEEHTVVLSVEIENIFPDIPAPTVSNYSFEVERADVTVSGTGAKTVLVTWGEAVDIFPVRIGPNEQVNLLYAVSFLRAPEVDEMTVAPGTGGQTGKRASGASAAATAAQEMRRSVSINISVRPFDRPSASLHANASILGPVSYPTRTYASYWSCKLNFSSTTNAAGGRFGEEGIEPTALPTPASPFPNIAGRVPSIVASNSAQASRPQSVPIPSVAGSRKFTYSALDSPAIEGRTKTKSPVNYQGPTAMLNPANQPQSAAIPLTADPRNLNPIITGTSPGAGSRASFVPPSVAFQSTYLRSPTTYTSPQDSYFSFAALGGGYGQTDIAGAEEPSTPRTPAYPAYPGSPLPVPPTPFWQAPLAQQTGAGAIGPTIDMRRDRGNVGSAPTPGVTIPGFPSNVEVSAEVENKTEAGGQPIVVSVGLLPGVKEGSSKGEGRASGDIYPLDHFTLDIFVFNQSSWTRRFEVSHPEERRRRRKGRGAAKKADGGCPGIMSLENRVRIGPLLPSTCQSVRMDFLALAPGVHPIDELVLTDVQNGFKMHLRSVMDVVVCEP